MAKKYEVLVCTDAEADLEELTDYIEARVASERADRVFGRIKAAILKLETSPKRGRVVPELLRLGVSEYREVPLPPYRIIYYLSAQRVFVVAILDGRRDLEDLLARRFLR